MCPTLDSLVADPETRIYEEWVYYKVFPAILWECEQGWDEKKAKGWDTKQINADGKFGLILSLVDHTPQRWVFWSGVRDLAYGETCAYYYWLSLLQGMEIPRYFLISLIAGKKGIPASRGSCQKRDMGASCWEWNSTEVFCVRMVKESEGIWA